jgi:hypothetical protein
MLHDAVAEIEMDETLIGSAGVYGDALEVRDSVFRKAHGHGLLEF